jgi:hypothetical protein
MDGLTEENTEPNLGDNITGDWGEKQSKGIGIDVMHEFGLRLFDTAPYNLVQGFYNRSTRELIILVTATFLLYNGFRCILQTMCEDGGFRKVFQRSESTLDEITRRLPCCL